MYTHYPAYHVLKVVIGTGSEALYYFKGFRIYVFCLINEQCRCEFRHVSMKILIFCHLQSNMSLLSVWSLAGLSFENLFRHCLQISLHLCACIHRKILSFIGQIAWFYRYKRFFIKPYLPWVANNIESIEQMTIWCVNYKLFPVCFHLYPVRSFNQWSL